MFSSFDPFYVNFSTRLELKKIVGLILIDRRCLCLTLSSPSLTLENSRRDMFYTNIWQRRKEMMGGGDVKGEKKEEEEEREEKEQKGRGEGRRR